MRQYHTGEEICRHDNWQKEKVLVEIHNSMGQAEYSDSKCGDGNDKDQQAYDPGFPGSGQMGYPSPSRSRIQVAEQAWRSL